MFLSVGICTPVSPDVLCDRALSSWVLPGSPLVAQLLRVCLEAGVKGQCGALLCSKVGLPG